MTSGLEVNRRRLWWPHGRTACAIPMTAIALVAMTFAAPRASSSQSTACFERVGIVTGDLGAIEIQNDIAWVAMDELVVGIDITDLTDPQIVSRTPIPRVSTYAHLGPRALIGLAASGSVLVAIRSTSLHVIDISDPASPQIVGSVDISLLPSGHTQRSVALSSGPPLIACVAVGRAGLDTYDLSDLTAPTYLGNAPPLVIPLHGNGEFNALGVDGVRGVAGEALSDTFQTLDLSNPSAPHAVAPITAFERVSQVMMRGDRAYGLHRSYRGTLAIVDISDLSQPVALGSRETSAELIAVAEPYVYELQALFGLTVVDASDPQDMLEVGGVTLPWAFDFADVWGSALIASHDRTLVFFNVADPTSPVVAAEIDLDYDTTSIAVANPYLVAGRSNRGVGIYDVSVPEYPVEIGAVDTPGVTRGVEAADGIVWVADDWAGVEAIDLSDPTAPRILDFLDTPGTARAVEVENGLVYVADGTEGLRILDGTQLPGIVELGSLDTPGVALNVDVVGDRAYIADWHGGLRIVDVSNPEVPVEIGTWESVIRVADVVVHGSVAFIASEFYDLSIDVSDPSSPMVQDILATGFLSPLPQTTRFQNFILVDSLLLDASDPANILSVDYAPANIADIHLGPMASFAAFGTDGISVLATSSCFGTIWADSFERGTTAAWSAGSP